MNLPDWWPHKRSYAIMDYTEGMKDLPDECVDLILTDPPYNISKKEHRIYRGNGYKYEGKDINLDFGNWDHGSVQPEDFIDEFIRVLKPSGVLCLFYERLSLGVIGLYLTKKYNAQVRHMGAWIKPNPAPQARKVKWQNGIENFIVVTKNEGAGHHFNYRVGQSPDYFIHSVNYVHEHPTEKPLRLFEWIIKFWSFRGDIILDPFLGSGTTLQASINLGRVGLGFEIDDQYEKTIHRKSLKHHKSLLEHLK